MTTSLRTCLLLPLLMFMFAQGARAQGTPAAPATTPAARGTPAAVDVAPATKDRLQREAERPLYWIKLHAEQAAKTAPPAAAASPPAEVRKPATAGSPLPTAPAVVPPVATATPAPRPEQTAKAAKPAAGASQAAAAEPVLAAAEPAAPGPAPEPERLLALAPPAAAAPAPAPTAAALVGPPEPLQLISSPEPDFPIQLVQRLRKGSLQIKLEVSTEGLVVGASVLRSSHPRLESPALAAVRTWQFKPPKQPSSLVVDYKFDIDG